MQKCRKDSIVFYLLSNSNPTWNSIELELVEVGVDFVFQCHNKKMKNKKNNPHLILHEGKDLHNLKLGIEVHGRCLVGIWTKNLFEPKIFGTKMFLGLFWTQIFSGPKHFWTQILSGSNFFQDLNIFGTQIISGPKFSGTQFFWYQNFFKTQNFSLKISRKTKFLGPNIFWEQKFFWDPNFCWDTQYFGTQIFFYPNFF